MKGISRFAGICVLPLAGLGVAACMPFLEGDLWQSPPPAGARAVQTDLKSSLGYYEKAVTAIDNRQYALALEYLQAAKSRKPDDVRVLTAFGVIYDKLGRFDLSARYYSQAAALDPKSRIIAADMDYSRKLQGISGSGPVAVAANAGPGPAQASEPRAVAVVEAAPSPPLAAGESQRQPARLVQDENPTKAAGARPVAKAVFPTGHPMIVDASGRNDVSKVAVAAKAGPGPFQVAKPRAVAVSEAAPKPPVAAGESQRQPLRLVREENPPKAAGMTVRSSAKGIFLTGHPMTIVDASGRSDMSKSVRTYLSSLGWSVAKDDGAKLPARPQTMIVYQETTITAARALARTLSLPMRLSANNSVQGLQLVLGSDVSRSNLAARPQARPRQLALAISKPTRE